MIDLLDRNIELEDKVKRIREELYSLVDEFGLDNLKVLEFSRELDELILTFIGRK